MKLSSLVLFLFLCNSLLAQTEQELDYATFLGGSEFESAKAIDSRNGDVVIVGHTASIDNIASSNAHQTIYGGGDSDDYIALFSEENELLWSSYFGGSGLDMFNSAIIMNDSSIIAVGWTFSTDAIASDDAYQDILNGPSDMMIVKFDYEGNVIWSTYFGGSLGENAFDVSAILDSTIIVVGESLSDDLSTSDAYQLENNGEFDGIISIFSADGELSYCSYFGGIASESTRGVVADEQGSYYICGLTPSTESISSVSAHQVNHGGGFYDGYLAKFSSDNTLSWSTYYGGSSEDQVYSVELLANGSIVISGSTTSNEGIATSGADNEINQSSDSFIACFDSDGNRNWGTYFGGEWSESETGFIDVYDNDIYIVGNTTSSTGIFLGQAYKPYISIDYDEPLFLNIPDIYLAKFNHLGEQKWGTYYGTLSEDYVKGVACVDENSLAIFGNTTSEDSIITIDAFQSINNGFNDFIYARFDINIEVGINEFSTINTSVYPNPCNGEIRIISDYNSGPANLMIYSMDGRIVYSSTYYFGDQLNLDLRSGSYVLKIVTDEGFSTSILSIVE